jgi:transmembrane sensor
MAEDAEQIDEATADAARHWIARMASGDMAEAELALFKTWRAARPEHDRAFAQQRSLWRAVGAAPALPRYRRWVRRRGGNGIGRRSALAVAIGTGAVAAAVIVAVPDIGVRLRADHLAGAGVESVTLPDGSTAMLDADAAIAVHFGQGERRIEILRGEAWFDVAHGDARPFRVAALDGVTEDVGTAFSVRREDRAVTVAVTQGEVRVATQDHAAQPLIVAQRLRYLPGQAPERLVDLAPADIAPWRNGELLLKDADVRSAVAGIGRYRHGPVLILGDTARSPRISGAFRTDRTDEAIDAVARIGHLSVRRFAGITILRPTD